MKLAYWFVFPVFFGLLLSYPVSANVPKEVKRILILHSESKENPGQQLTEQGIRSILVPNQSDNMEIFVEYLDVSRFGSPAAASAIADFLRRRYAGI